jgi:16S rRNA (guanine527-N7)-methyltransferase
VVSAALASQRVGTALSKDQVQALSAYLEELERWNRRVNLTSVAVNDAWRRHIEESLHLLGAANPARGSRIVDVGSGTGAPGLVVAVARPDLGVVLIEADARKAAFLRHAAGKLRLENVQVAATRAEEAGRDPDLRERFDLAISRAAAPPPVLVELALPLLAIGGRLCALVGDPQGAARQCRTAAERLGGGPPEALDGETLMVPKRAATPEDFPRRPGAPSRRPLG